MKEVYGVKGSKNHRGFSMVELIIVLAIIGALIVVLVPSYIKYVQTAREVVCNENVHQAHSAFAVETVSEGRDNDAALMDSVVTALGGEVLESGVRYSGLCPAKGVTTATFTENGVFLSCNKHPGNNAPLMGNAATSLDAALKKLGFKLGYGSRIDSTSTDGTKRAQVIKAMTEAGVDITSENIKSWAIVRTHETLPAGVSGGSGAGELFLWSSYDAAEYKVGDQLPVICYNKTTGGYTVGMTNIATPGAGQSYNIIGRSADKNGFGTDSTNKSQNFETYEDALKAYKELEPVVKKK